MARPPIREFVCPVCGNTVYTQIRGDYPEVGVYCYGKDTMNKHRKRVMKEQAA